MFKIDGHPANAGLMLENCAALIGDAADGHLLN